MTLSFLSENQKCSEGRYWAMRRIGTSNTYQVTVEIKTVQASDFRDHSFTMMGPSFRTDSSDSIEFTLPLRESGKSKGIEEYFLIPRLCKTCKYNPDKLSLTDTPIP